MGLQTQSRFDWKKKKHFPENCSIWKLRVNRNTESESYYLDELQFQQNGEFKVLNYDWVGVGEDEWNSHTAFNEP